MAQPERGWKCRTGGQLKTWLSTIKDDLDVLGLQKVYGLRKWKSDWLKICCEMAVDSNAWAATIRDIEAN